MMHLRSRAWLDEQLGDSTGRLARLEDVSDRAGREGFALVACIEDQANVGYILDEYLERLRALRPGFSLDDELEAGLERARFSGRVIVVHDDDGAPVAAVANGANLASLLATPAHRALLARRMAGACRLSGELLAVGTRTDLVGVLRAGAAPDRLRVAFDRAQAAGWDRHGAPLGYLTDITDDPALARGSLELELVGASHKVGRNDPCPCGSGRKFKRCCGA